MPGRLDWQNVNWNDVFCALPRWLRRNHCGALTGSTLFRNFYAVDSCVWAFLSSSEWVSLAWRNLARAANDLLVSVALRGNYLRHTSVYDAHFEQGLFEEFR